MKSKLILLLSTLSILLPQLSHAEEGMWPFNQVPLKHLSEKYGININQEWLQQVQLSSLRVSLGGSASFVSSKGLVMTNHHVGSKAIHNLSTEVNDLLKNGFYATHESEELHCENMYVDQLISIQDITDKVNALLSKEVDPQEREKKRKAILADIVDKTKEESGLQPEIVALYQGAKYHLYLYKRYTDVRLVMAPEKSIAYFGGEEHNFEYPRMCLDVCFFRVYENDKPLDTSTYFKWSQNGPKLQEPLFTSGHPGRTDRSRTLAHLYFMKTVEVPLLLDFIDDRIAQLEAFSEISEENRRIAEQDLFSLKNAQKVYKAIREGLQNPSIFENKEKFENSLFDKCNEAQKQPWITLQNALENAKKYYTEYTLVEGTGSRYNKLYGWAKTIVRATTEKAKPSNERLKEYGDSELPSLELELFTEEPYYPSLDRVLLINSFTRAVRLLGNYHPITKILLNNKSVEARVSELMENSKLSDVEYRKALYNSPEPVKTSNDPFIMLALALDPYSRDMRKKKENELDALQKDSYEKIQKMIFERFQETLYPDATFTLRLSIGEMKGYEEDGKLIPPMTTFADAYNLAREHHNKEPFNLPKSWLVNEDKINKNTPFDFISTNDIIGGNSGSPIINGNREIVGIIFDGNKQSLIWDVEFNQEQGRAISVDSTAIISALKNIYHAKRLIDEIQPNSTTDQTPQ